MTSEKEKQELKDEKSMQNDNNEETTMPEIIYARGGKEDFVSLINASYETNGWIRKYRDYDCYRKMLGPTKLHDIAARTRSWLQYFSFKFCISNKRNKRKTLYETNRANVKEPKIN